VLFEHPMSGHLTVVRDGSASLGTPTTDNRVRSERFRSKNPMTPRNPERSNELSDQIAALLPTPVVNDMGAGKTVEDWDTWTDEMKAKHGNGNGHGPSLSIEAQRLLPTPTVNDSHNHNSPPSQFNRSSLALPALMKVLPSPQHWDHKVFGPNVDWKKRAESHADSVASVLMNLPLNDGDESSDDPPPTQQMIEGCDPDSSNG